MVKRGWNRIRIHYVRSQKKNQFDIRLEFQNWKISIKLMIGWKKGEEQSSWAIHPIGIGIPLFKVRKTWFYALCLAVLWFIEIKPRRSECAYANFLSKCAKGKWFPYTWITIAKLAHFLYLYNTLFWLSFDWRIAKLYAAKLPQDVQQAFLDNFEKKKNQTTYSIQAKNS